MGLEDLCMFRAIPNSTVFYPSDAVSTEKAVELAANTKVCNSSAVCLLGSFRAGVGNLLALHIWPASSFQASLTPDIIHDIRWRIGNVGMPHCAALPKCSGH